MYLNVTFFGKVIFGKKINEIPKKMIIFLDNFYRTTIINLGGQEMP